MKKNAGMHGSPYSYDTHVPLFLFGPGVAHAHVTTRVDMTDLAPTIAAYLGMPAPSASSGTPLDEVLEGIQLPE